MADQAFRLGQLATVGITVAVISIMFWQGQISLPGALMALFLGLPVVFILVACVLGVWLGYNQEPLVPVTVTDHDWPLDPDDEPSNEP